MEHVLDDRFGDVSIAQRMSWASHRSTTRIEDEAYCLLGLFGINMPLIYGEGRRAFLRLQEEILQRSSDQSIFAWRLFPKTMPNPYAILAPSPQHFQHSGTIVKLLDDYYEPTYSLTNRGLYIEAHVVPASGLIWKKAVSEEMKLAGERMEGPKQADGVGDNEVIYLLPLNCYDSNNVSNKGTKKDPWMLAIRGMKFKFSEPEKIRKDGGFSRAYMTEEVKRRIWAAFGATFKTVQITVEAYPWHDTRDDGKRLYER